MADFLWGNSGKRLALGREILRDGGMLDEARYDGRMPYRRCGKSGLCLPLISLGLWHNFGAIDDFHEARRMLVGAMDAGITHFDLANNYGPPAGSAEETFGKIWREELAGHRDEMVISTKAGHLMWDGPYGDFGSRKHVLASLDQSLARMKLDYVDIFYSHRPDPETPLEETISALVTAVRSGRALYVGLSKYPLDRLQQAVALLKEEKIPCLVYQPPYSMLNRKVEADGILGWAAENGIGNAVFSPLAQGMLTAKYLGGIPQGSRAARAEGFLREDQVAADLQRVGNLGKIAADCGVPLHHLALAWALQQPWVTTAIVGARTVAQLDDTLLALKVGALSEEVLRQIEEVVPV